MNKIAIILPNLKSGGAEKILSFLSNNLDKKKFVVYLIVVGYEKDSVYEVDCNCIYLNKNRFLFALPQIIYYIIKINPHCILGSIVHINMFLCFFKMIISKKKVIIREASVVSEMNKFTDKVVLSSNRLIGFLYKMADKIICQSNDMKDDLNKNFFIPIDKLIVINNPITSNHVFPLNQSEKKTHESVKFITVGRLSPEKGYLRILRILSKLKDFEYEYTIVGDGPDLEMIYNEAIKLGIQNRINHVKFTKDVYSIINKHDLFLQGSYVEGFPNSVLESCFVGVPVIAFESKGGTSEIVKNGLTGYIVSTEDEYLDILINKEKYLELDRSSIKKYVSTKFSTRKILNEYERLILKTIN